MSIKHTSSLIKSNLQTILTEFPNAFIRPCNKYEQHNAAPTHTREQHHFAHICVTSFTVENNNTSNFRRYEQERYFYVTSSTTDWVEHDTLKCISFRKELIDIWTNTGFCDVIWFIKNTDKYMILTADEVRNNLTDAIKNNQHKLYNVDGRDYIAFPVIGTTKTRAKEFPEFSAFDPKYASTFDYIQNVTYTERRNYNGTVYAVAWIPDASGMKVVTKEYVSIKEAFDKQTTFAANGYRTCVRRTQAGVAQKLIELYENEGYVVYFTYNKEELDDLDALYERITKKQTKKVNVLNTTVTVEEVVTKEVEEVVTDEIELRALNDVAAEAEYEVDFEESDEAWDKASPEDIKECLNELSTLKEEFRKKCDLNYIRQQEYANAVSLF